MDIEKQLNQLVPKQELAMHQIATSIDIIKAHLNDKRRPSAWMLIGGDKKLYIQTLLAVCKVMHWSHSKFLISNNTSQGQTNALLAINNNQNNQQLSHNIVIVCDTNFTDSDEYLLQCASESRLHLEPALQYMELQNRSFMPELVRRISKFVLFNQGYKN